MIQIKVGKAMAVINWLIGLWNFELLEEPRCLYRSFLCLKKQSFGLGHVPKESPG